jgi:serine/threonine-protein kinase
MKKYLGVIAAAFLLFEGANAGAAFAGDKFGAVATGSNASYGYSYNYDSQEAAEAAALSYCSNNGSNCAVQVWFANACGAVAKGGGYVGWAYNVDEVAAYNNAIAACSAAGGSNCEFVAGACTDR